MTKEQAFEKLNLLYQENAKVAAVFWEWRHKVMVSCFVGVATLFALAGWFYQQPALRWLLFAPLFIAAVLSFVSFFLDQRNAGILRECYRIGKEIEHDLIGKGAIYESIGGSPRYYTVILGGVYIVVGVVLLFTSVWAIKFLA